MFLRKIRLQQGGKEYTYLKVVENVRERGRPVQKTLVNLGNVNQWPEERIEHLVGLLNRFLGRSLPEGALQSGGVENVRFEACRQLGPYLPLVALWDRLGLDAILDRELARRRLDPLARDCVKVMVLTRLVAPCSKRAVSELAVEHAQIPGVDASRLPLHLYYRALSFLADVRTPVEKAIFGRVGHLFNRDLSLVFYDLTSASFEGTHCEMARYGYSREHRPDLLQIEIALMVDSEGLPIGHEVFEGNLKDVTTVLGALDRLKDTFGVRRCVFVGDDGMASAENLHKIAERGYEYITSLSLGKSAIGQTLLADVTPWRWEAVEPSMYVQLLDQAGGRAHIGVYNPQTARSTRHRRRRRLRESIAHLKGLQGPVRGRRKRTDLLPLADRFLRRKRTSQFFRVQIIEGQIEWSLDREALRRARRQDGVLVLVTNSQTLEPVEVARGYRTLWRVENAFRHMKDVIRLRPIRHWNDSRVMGHVFVCVLAYLLECLYDRALREASLDTSARTALGRLATVTVATLTHEGRQIRRRSEITAGQRMLLTAAGVNHLAEVW